MRTPVASWGRLEAAPHDSAWLFDRAQLPRCLVGQPVGIAHGLGRSYGDVCLNPDGRLWRTSALDHLIGFDAASGVLECEAGVTLRDIQQLMLPRGWRLAVTPGTQWVTVGGAIANDVHGKNHAWHGSFGHHVLGLRLARSDGRLIDCSPEQNADWLAATIGGLGLTGVIVQARLQLQRACGAWLDTDTEAFVGLPEFLRLSDAATPDWEHTVAWLDTSGRGAVRGLFMRARAADDARPAPARRARRVPLTPPVSLVNRLSLRAFNTLYFRAKRRGAARLAHDAFLYPLDELHEWNRLYGPRGFYQYQCVLPRAQALGALQAMLDAIAVSGDGSFLNVLKTFGTRAGAGLLSFARPGVTLAVDFPNRGARTLALLDRLDAIVDEAGGCLYPAKDARMPRALFERGYPRLPEFQRYRDPGLASAMSRRLMGPAGNAAMDAPCAS